VLFYSWNSACFLKDSNVHPPYLLYSPFIFPSAHNRLATLLLYSTTASRLDFLRTAAALPRGTVSLFDHTHLGFIHITWASDVYWPHGLPEKDTTICLLRDQSWNSTLARIIRSTLFPTISSRMWENVEACSIDHDKESTQCRIGLWPLSVFSIIRSCTSFLYRQARPRLKGGI
jgi:hypothetical protein